MAAQHNVHSVENSDGNGSIKGTSLRDNDEDHSSVLFHVTTSVVEGSVNGSTTHASNRASDSPPPTRGLPTRGRSRMSLTAAQALELQGASSAEIGEQFLKQSQFLSQSFRSRLGRDISQCVHRTGLGQGTPIEEVSAREEAGGELYQHSVSPTEKAWGYFLQFRYLCGTFVNNPRVQMCIVCMIAINAIMMGIGTYKWVREDPTIENAFKYCDMVFLIIFTIELGMQFAFYGWRLLLDGWLVFDLIIITLSWAFEEVQIVRAFRIFRTFRLITRVKVLKNLVLGRFLATLGCVCLSLLLHCTNSFSDNYFFRILWSPTAISSVMPRMFAIAILLQLVSYIYAVMFTQLFKDLYEEGDTLYDYFGRMDHTLFTLFQIMTLDEWAGITREVMNAPGCGWAWLPIITFVIITSFVVVNLIIAVICDAISALNDDDRKKLTGQYEGEDSHFDEDSDLFEDDGTEQDLRVRLVALEEHVDLLAKMQEDSLVMLDLMTRRLQANIVAMPTPKQPQSSASKESGLAS
jgi:hypothetical protein